MKININNADKLEAAIKKAEGKATQRLFDTRRIDNAIRDAEKKLNEIGIAKKYQNGCEIRFKPAKVPNSYKYRAEGTFVIIERFSSGWFLVDCYRAPTGTASYGSNEAAELILDDVSRDHIPYIYKL